MMAAAATTAAIPIPIAQIEIPHSVPQMGAEGSSQEEPHGAGHGAGQGAHEVRGGASAA